MGKIIQLDPQLINQIAAGEVVERPLSVVKELIENSIDAGAQSIKVEIHNGGIDSIIVSDNGIGLEKEDLELITKKHTTSKIASLDDLQNVMTFGFRGEAIASISSISDFEIISKHKNNPLGYSYKNQEISEATIDSGTKVIVENIFSKTPARLHYLKKPKTEYAKIYEFIMAMALSYPHIGFALISDAKQTLYFPEEQKLPTRINIAFGNDFGNNILDIHAGISGLELTGYISDPKIHMRNRNKQLLYVNKRLIKSPMVQKAISDAYNRYIPHGTFPAYVLNVSIDPTQIDVNVHPRKQEIRFADESQIFRLVYHAVADRLQSVNLISHSSSETEPQVSDKNSENYYSGSGTKFKSYSPYKDTRMNPAQSQITDALKFSQALSTKTHATQNNEGDDTLMENHTQQTDLHYTKMGKIIGQTFNSYIIVETPSHLQILDQHALAERIIYEKLVHNFYQGKTQGLLIGESISLSASEYSTVQENADVFSLFGFDFELLGNHILQINGIPDFVNREDIQDIVSGVIQDITESKIGQSKTLDEIRNKIAAYTACRSAIKFGNKLNLFEMNKLLNDAVLDYSATCPHGRPVITDFSLDELKTMYDR